jgi:hypothetical protein
VVVPLLTQTPVESLVKPDVTGGDDSTCCWVVNKVPVGVGRVADHDSGECCVIHFTTLAGWNMDVGWAAEYL